MENLPESIDFPMKYGGFPVFFPLNQSNDYLQNINFDIWL